ELVEDHAVQLVDLRPWQLAAAQALHRRLIAAAPLLGECLPIEGDAALAAEGCQLAQDAAMPVDHGAEHVEDQRLDAAAHILRHRISPCAEPPSLTTACGESRWQGRRLTRTFTRAM